MFDQLRMQTIFVGQQGNSYFLQEIAKIVATNSQKIAPASGFNLRRHLQKKANYEGAQGYFVAQTRSWQNCVRRKQMDGTSAQDAWEGCLQDYQQSGNNLDWVAQNCHEDDVKLQKKAQQAGQFQMGSYWDRIDHYKQRGLTTAQAVFAALGDCRRDGDDIPPA
jgi:hypothetical protein